MSALRDARGIASLKEREERTGNYEPGVTYEPKEFAERLLKRRPPGDAQDPRRHGRWRAA